MFRKCAITIYSLLFLVISTPALALRPSDTPASKIVMAEAMALLEKRDFVGLEKNLELYLKNGERIEDGQWKFHIAMDGIDGNAAQFAEDAATVERSFVLISDWVTQKPESIMAKTALAHAWLSKAWLYRGMKLASETSTQQFDSFEKGLENAFQVLRDIDDSHDVNPEVYMAWLSFAVGAGIPVEVTDNIYTKATQQFPDYHYITLQYLVTKFERWSGDQSSLPSALKRIATDPELFARAVWHLVVYREKMDVLDTGYNQVAQEGFLLIKEKFKSPITTNQTGFLACFQWHDSSIAEKSIAAIGNNPDATLWINLDNYKNCVKWADACKRGTVGAQ